MKLSSNLLTSVTLIAFALLLFSCKKQATEEKKISGRINSVMSEGEADWYGFLRLFS